MYYVKHRCHAPGETQHHCNQEVPNRQPSRNSQGGVKQEAVYDEANDGHDDPADVRPYEATDEDDGVEDEVGDGEELGAVVHREGAGAAAEVVQPDAHLEHQLQLTSVPKLVFASVDNVRKRPSPRQKLRPFVARKRVVASRGRKEEDGGGGERASE